MKDKIIELAIKIANLFGVGYDKVLHFGVIFISTICTVFISWWLAFVVFVTLSFGKELYDSRQPYNHFCWYDILADTVGFITANFIYLLTLLK